MIRATILLGLTAIFFASVLAAIYGDGTWIKVAAVGVAALVQGDRVMEAWCGLHARRRARQHQV